MIFDLLRKKRDIPPLSRRRSRPAEWRTAGRAGRRRPRIGLFSYNFLPHEGGQGRNFYEVFRRFQNHQEIDLLAFSPHTLRFARHRSTLETVHRYPLAQLIFSLLLDLRLRKIIRDEGLDLLLINGGPGGIFLLRRPRTPVVYCANHTYARQSQLVRGERWKKMLIPFESRSYHFARKLVAISTATRRELVERYRVDAEKITVVPVGVDTSVFRPLEVDRIPRSIFFLGRLDRRKGIDFLVETLPLVKSRVPDVRLLVAGSGKLRRRLEAYIRERSLEENVELLGRLDDEDLAPWYNRCEIQVVPSIFEGLGIVVLEGLACGTLLVATRGSGIDDIVDHGDNGFFVDYGDKSALADRIVELLSHPERYHDVRRNARWRVVEHFSWEKIVARYETFFRDEIFPGLTERGAP